MSALGQACAPRLPTALCQKLCGELLGHQRVLVRGCRTPACHTAGHTCPLLCSNTRHRACPTLMFLCTCPTLDVLVYQLATYGRSNLQLWVDASLQASRPGVHFPAARHLRCSCGYVLWHCIGWQAIRSPWVHRRCGTLQSCCFAALPMH